MGAEQEAITGLRTRSGDLWGALALYRTLGVDLAHPYRELDAFAQADRRASRPLAGDRRGVLLRSGRPSADDWAQSAFLRPIPGNPPLNPGS